MNCTEQELKITSLFKARKPRVNLTKDQLHGEVRSGKTPSKHNIKTPVKTKPKHVKRKSSDDVHNAHPSPEKPAVPSSQQIQSASLLVSCSQEPVGDVIWNFRSPGRMPQKLDGGRNSRACIANLVKRMTRNQRGTKVGPSKSLHSSELGSVQEELLSLVDEWKNCVVVDKEVEYSARCIRNDCKVPPMLRVFQLTREIEDLLEKTAMNSFTATEAVEETVTCLKVPSQCREHREKPSEHSSKTGLLASAWKSSDDLSTDDLWGEDDESFIMQATQASEDLLDIITIDASYAEIPETVLCEEFSVPAVKLHDDTNKAELCLPSPKNEVGAKSFSDEDSDWGDTSLLDEILSSIPEDLFLNEQRKPLPPVTKARVCTMHASTPNIVTGSQTVHQKVLVVPPQQRTGPITRSGDFAKHIAGSDVHPKPKGPAQVRLGKPEWPNQYSFQSNGSIKEFPAKVQYCTDVEIAQKRQAAIERRQQKQQQRNRKS